MSTIEVAAFAVSASLGTFGGATQVVLVMLDFVALVAYFSVALSVALLVHRMERLSVGLLVETQAVLVHPVVVLPAVVQAIQLVHLMERLSVGLLAENQAIVRLVMR